MAVTLYNARIVLNLPVIGDVIAGISIVYRFAVMKSRPGWQGGSSVEYDTGDTYAHLIDADGQFVGFLDRGERADTHAIDILPIHR